MSKSPPSLLSRLACHLQPQRPTVDEARKLYATLAADAAPGVFECQESGASWSGGAFELDGVDSEAQGRCVLTALAAYLPAYLEVLVAVHRVPAERSLRSYLFVRGLRNRGQSVAHTAGVVLGRLRLAARPLTLAELQALHAGWLTPATPEQLLHIELKPLPGTQPAAVPPLPDELKTMESWSYAVLQVLPMAQALDELKYRHLRSQGGLLRKPDGQETERTRVLLDEASSGKLMAYARWGSLLRCQPEDAGLVRTAAWEPARQAGFQALVHPSAFRCDLLQALPWLRAPADTIRDAQHVLHLDSVAQLAPMLPFKRRLLLPRQREAAGYTKP